MMTSRLDFLECRDCRCLSARSVAQELTRAYDDALRPHGITINQFSVLAALMIADKLPLGELAKHIGVDRTTMTRNLALCERMGWVRLDTGGDRRVRLVRISDAGRAVAVGALPAWRAAQQKALAD
jgi:DNA-binding MarR family transcriptional regulator